MIVRAGVTPKPAIERALAGLDPHKVLGLVLNETGTDGSGRRLRQLRLYRRITAEGGRDAVVQSVRVDAAA